MVVDEPFDHRISFLNSNGGEAAPPEVILPFGFYCPISDTFHPHATGFYFSWEGLICSAKHAFEFDKRFRAQMSHLSDRSYLVAYQIMPDRTFVYRRIMAAHAHPKYDLAVAILEATSNNHDFRLSLGV